MLQTCRNCLLRLLISNVHMTYVLILDAITYCRFDALYVYEHLGHVHYYYAKL